MGTKINVELHVSLPMESGAWLKTGLDAMDIDVDGDIEAQTQKCLAAWIKVTRILNDGMQEEVAGLLIDPDEAPTAVKASLEEANARFDRLERVIGRVVTKVRELADTVEDAEEKPEAEETPKEQKAGP